MNPSPQVRPARPWLLSILTLGVLALAAPPAARADILAEVYCDGICGDPLLLGLKNNLIAAAIAHGAGAVTWVEGANPGSMAADLTAGNYNQVFVWDITATPGLTNAADQAALDAWYANSRSAVIDGRSYGQYFQGGNGFEDDYISNVVKNFLDNNGGLWVGTDHEPTWTNNGNDYLNALGFNPVINDIQLTDLSLNGANPYMSPTALSAPGLSWNWSGGQVPVGLQPNGLVMQPLAWVNGGMIPMISTRLPEPATGLLLIGIVCGMARRRRDVAVR